MENYYMPAVRAEIRAELAAREESKKELAEAVGVAYPSLNRYLSGDREIPLGVLLDTLVHWDVDMATFWKRVEDRIDYLM